MNCAPHCSGLAAGALMAGVAALGWWVLTKAEKESHKALLWSGRVLGWVLLAGGLAGFLCAVTAHSGRAWKACQTGPALRAPGGPLPPGHPPLGQTQ